MANYKNIVVEAKNGRAWITVNRPQVRNALNAETVEEFHAALRTLGKRWDVGVVLLTGAGDKAFVAGADIRELRERGQREGLEAINQELFNAIENLPQPVIAVVNGYALGGGCELALACDLRIASETAKFGFPETALGIIPAAGGTQRLPRLIGWSKAKELILAGETFDAQEAARLGLVSQVVPPAKLREAAEEWAEKILSRGPVATRLAKLALNTAARTGLAGGLVVEKLAQSILLETRDKKEAMTAFLEKRKPKFHGE